MYGVDMLDAIVGDAKEALLISAGILLLFALGEWLHRSRKFRVEITRKMTHVGAGCIVMSFPWMLTSPWTVCALSVSFGTLLVLGKVTGMLSSVHDVQRKTSGACYHQLGWLWSPAVEGAAESFAFVRRAGLLTMEGTPWLAIEFRDPPKDWVNLLRKATGVQVKVLAEIPGDPRHNAKVERMILRKQLRG